MLNPGKEPSDSLERWKRKEELTYVELSPVMQKARGRLGTKAVVAGPEGDRAITENHHAKRVVIAVAKGTRTVTLRTKNVTPVRRLVTTLEFAQTKARVHLQAPERLPSPTKSELGKLRTISLVTML